MKKITLALSFLLFTIFSIQTFAQTIITFDDQGWVDEEFIGTSVTLSGYNFSATEGGTVIPMKVDNGNSSSGLSLVANNVNFIAGDILTITKSGGGNFDINSFHISGSTFLGQLTVRGYSGGMVNVTQTDISPIDGTFILTDLLWNSVDEVQIERISGGFGLVVNFDDFSLDAASDIIAPTLTSSSPTDGATGISTNSNIVLTFNENIAFGTGDIQVIDVTDGSNSFTINAASPASQASISGTVLTINPSADMDGNTNYAVQISATAINDISGNSYAGITNNSTLDFTTVAPTPLTITVAANNKTYNGTLTATVGAASLMGVSSGDDVSINGVPSAFNFTSTNVGSGITVNATGNYTITGADAGKYTLTQPSFSANITAAALTVTADVGQTKTYGATDPILTYTISGFVNGDLEADLDTPVSIARVAGENSGAYTITPSAATDLNYAVSFVTNPFAITTQTLTVTVAANSKNYDGTTAATVGTASLAGVEAGDDISIDGVPSAFNFATKNASNSITVTATGNYTITGTDAGNYSVTQPSNLTADITKKELTITGLTGNDKVFDGTTIASASGIANLSGVFASDIVPLGGSPVYTFATSNIGTGITITTTGYTISGGDSGNYTLVQPVLSATITGDTLTIDDISVTHVTCNGIADGSVVATISGGSAPYSYAWSTGATTTENFLNNLTGGDYSVTIVDALSNSVMQNFTIAEGTPIEATVTQGATVYLGYTPAATATITVETITGGNAPYTYQWNTGETTQSIEVSPTETTTYTVTITDLNGCSTTADALVSVIDVRCGHHGHHNKVKVCHKGRKTICVPWWAARWHLKHGDTLGGCNSDSNEVQITNLKVYPNPFKHHLHVKFNSTMDADVDLTVFNNRGRQVFRKSLSITEGDTKTKLNLSKLRRGYYYLKVVVNGEVKKIRHLIKR